MITDRQEGESWFDYYKRLGKLPKFDNYYEPPHDPKKPQGNVCATLICFNVSDDKISKIMIIGGCNGNVKAVARLVEGLAIEDAIKKLKSIKCSDKTTSCGDQIAKAFMKWCKDNARPTVEQQIETLTEQVETLTGQIKEIPDKVSHLTDIVLAMEDNINKFIEVVSLRKT